MKVLIDKFFTDNYSKLKGITELKISYFKRNIDAESLISNAYIYVISKADKLTEGEIPSWVIGYINTELSFYNSKTLRKESVIAGDDKSPDIRSTYNFIDDFEQQDFSNAFKNTLTRIEQIVWEVYYDKGMRSAGDLAAHFDIPRTSAWQLKVEVMKKLDKYVSTEK